VKKWQIGWSQHCPVFGRLHICARHSVERIAQRGEVFDFAHEVAVPFPLRIMMDILGLPEKDDPLVLKLARGLTGAEDPDRALSGHPAESMRLAGIGFRTYFDIVTADRRAARRVGPDPRSSAASHRCRCDAFDATEVACELITR
jgi:cytochrome P450